MEAQMLREVLDLGMAGVAIVVMGLVIRHLYGRCQTYEKDILTMALGNQERNLVQIKEYVDTFKIVLKHLRDGGG